MSAERARRQPGCRRGKTSTSPPPRAPTHPFPREISRNAGRDERFVLHEWEISAQQPKPKVHPAPEYGQTLYPLDSFTNLVSSSPKTI